MTETGATGPLTVLVTRPEPGGSSTAAALRAAGHVPVLAPCLEIEALPAALPPLVDAIVVASAQALPGLPPALRAVPLFAVGDATAARARAAGFISVASAAGTAQELAELVGAQLDPGARLLLACGAGHSLGLAADLRRRGFRVTRRVVYRSRPARELDTAARAALEAGEVDRVMVFSPASARSFAALVTEAGLDRALAGAIGVAISPAAAAPLSRLPFREIRSAVSPDQDHMLPLLP
ncbi:uroporphyrinogen-III synthase [Acidiphilium sp.]|uniref:uroporphyrinogen-III synthase n=1 Tax=Acidiphilium sp. TaxID=527 RepID=UPI000BCC81A5|nr:uroporphyrinogen-III synthase [Acidiphilium sp.]OYV57188.1 MAG: uroporphyrinogen III synthase [Acidiphilium sp. 20-67-58]OYV85718.1 MAG: uroporphyrinogen III synthase [Acidiphilium sp. 21-68-69]HQT60596.1 uroporphyrinogen-III synthase [Acidiphilium sp.]